MVSKPRENSRGRSAAVALKRQGGLVVTAAAAARQPTRRPMVF